jgi:hypothetical protein
MDNGPKFLFSPTAWEKRRMSEESFILEEGMEWKAVQIIK